MIEKRFSPYTALPTQLVMSGLCVLLLCFLVTPIGAADKTSLIGDWTLNRELTEERRPKLPKAKSSRSGFGTNVAVGAGGVLMPVPTRNTGPNPGGATANLPHILACQELSLTKNGSDIVVTCPQMLEPRKFVVGKVHGRTVRWSNRSLSEKYSSTSRRVTHAFKLERSGVMEIKITVKPKGSKRLTYIMVFDRAPADALNT